MSLHHTSVNAQQYTTRHTSTTLKRSRHQSITIYRRLAIIIFNSRIKLMFSCLFFFWVYRSLDIYSDTVLVCTFCLSLYCRLSRCWWMDTYDICARLTPKNFRFFQFVDIALCDRGNSYSVTVRRLSAAGAVVACWHCSPTPPAAYVSIFLIGNDVICSAHNP